MSDPRYFWEKPDSRRARQEAQACLDVFLQRLQAPAAAGADDPLLLDYVVEVHLNIAWYARHIAREERRRALLKALAVLFGALGVCAIPLLKLLQRDIGADGITLHLTTFAGAAFAVLRTLSSVDDAQASLGSFWRAESALSGLLYAFEQKWAGQFTLDKARADLEDGIVKARQIATDERQRFFDALSPPVPAGQLFHSE